MQGGRESRICVDGVAWKGVRGDGRESKVCVDKGAGKLVRGKGRVNKMCVDGITRERRGRSGRVKVWIERVAWRGIKGVECHDEVGER